MTGDLQPTLAEIGVRLAGLEAELARAQGAGAEVLAMAELIRDPRLKGDMEFTARWIEWFTGLDTEAKQTLPGGTFTIVVVKGGKGAKRV